MKQFFKKLLGNAFSSSTSKDVPKDYWKLAAVADELMVEMRKITKKVNKINQQKEKKVKEPIKIYSSIYSALQDIVRTQQQLSSFSGEFTAVGKHDPNENKKTNLVVNRQLNLLKQLAHSRIINLYNVIDKIKIDIQEKIKANEEKADELSKNDERFVKEITQIAESLNQQQK